ncbi:MAG: hypothetical protein JRF02_09085 [Deltaproteobacteria bacterium]|nr:hypothetical protein [Deltaproteobacteria bacterium]
MFFAFSSAVLAGDFGWIEDFNIQAQADPSGFRARLATRFNLNGVQVKAILSNFDRPADAYIMLRLGEMSGMEPMQVYRKYKHNKSKGWGALAKSMGIKPGSDKFHALKHGHDLYGGSNHRQAQNSKQKRHNANLVVNIHGHSKRKKNK